jgi:hypothetical protein
LLRKKPGYPLVSFLPAAKKGYRFYPLREPKPLRGFGFAEFALRANSWTPWWSLGLCPKLRKPKRLAFWFGLPAVFEL